MAATLGATLGAPLTAIVFAFGLTHDANALLPLLAATLVAHGFATVVMKRSIMTEKIARRGYHIYREYGVDPLERHDVAEVMTPAEALVAVDGATTLDAVDAQYFGAKQTHRAYPVVQNGRLLGVVDRNARRASRASRPRRHARQRVRRACAGGRAGARDVPRGRVEARDARARTAAGRRRSAVAAHRRHRVAQRPDQARAPALRRRAQARAVPSRRTGQPAQRPRTQRRLSAAACALPRRPAPRTSSRLNFVNNSSDESLSS
jgi:hypothetical protein